MMKCGFYMILFTVFFTTVRSSADSETKKLLLQSLNKETQENLNSASSQFKAILLIGYLQGCPIFKKYQPTLGKLKSKYDNELLIVNFDPSLEAEKSRKESLLELKKMKNNYPFVIDKNGQLNSKLKISTASEVVVLETKNFDVVYRGAIDDQTTYDYSKPEAKNNYARDVINKLVHGEESKFYSTTPFGCALNIKELPTKK